MVGKNLIKRIAALQQKKFRQAEGLFIAEGAKVISELLESPYVPEYLFVTEPLPFNTDRIKAMTIDAADLAKMSALSTANNALAVFRIPPTLPVPDQGLIVALDEVRDPGNLGTIIRLCDWFGISQLVCSEGCVDAYNPKVVQATMGSLARVQVSYVDLPYWLSQTKLLVFGTFMDGQDIYRQDLPAEGVIVLGNEANGISAAVEKTVKQRLSIPRFGLLQKTESLNVGTAAAIVLSEFRRKM